MEGEEESESDGNLEDFYTSDESESEGDDEDEEWGGIQSREQESHAKDTHPTPIRDPALGMRYSCWAYPSAQPCARNDICASTPAEGAG